MRSRYRIILHGVHGEKPQQGGVTVRARADYGTTSDKARMRTQKIAFGFLKLAQSVIFPYTCCGRSVLVQACSNLRVSAGTVIAIAH